MEREQTDSKTCDFIRFVKGLNEVQQIGLNVMIEGLKVMAEKKKAINAFNVILLP